MLFNNILIGVVVAGLLVSVAQVDAFSMCPKAVRSACQRPAAVAGHSSSPHVLAHVRQRSKAVSQGWLGVAAGRGRAKGGGALSMTETPGSVEEVTQVHLEEREFQVTAFTW